MVEISKKDRQYKTKKKYRNKRHYCNTSALFYVFVCVMLYKNE